ncbi:YbbR-like domain-containing protein [Bacillus sp. DNRA2]|uniref:CdaR family protein n=1 Tax=Bacillus sp. DNRA2 TaxID=2723053 RepID=UPI00145D82B1|nr:CdaR family protein [Bacillus sp. DNRA2]NMD72704.1 YbbR-like domain-containing protein [Bacillus sp. DNRA2]
MDKFMDNPWFMKGVALVLALLLFSSVSDGQGNEAKEKNVPANQQEETVKNVPVNSYFDTENFVVSGVPESVDVIIEGPKSIVQTTVSLKNFEVFVDLTDAKIGTQTVKLEVKNLSDKLDVTIKPATAKVTLQEKITKEFKVEAEFNQNLLDDGYTALEPVVQPNTVEITGAKGDVEKISYVKATVDVNGNVEETITKNAKVLAFDQQLNKLNVTIKPETVKVTIPIKNTNKTVPINIVQKGTLPSGIAIDSITLDNKDVKISGNEDIVRETESVRVEVDLSKISESTVISIPVIVPEGVTKVTPDVVKATIKVSKQEQKSISGALIKAEGLADGYDIVFRDPENGKISFTVSGSSETIKPLTEADFRIYLNVANLGEGDHEVPIAASGPNNVNLRLEKERAKISIVKKNEA